MQRSSSIGRRLSTNDGRYDNGADSSWGPRPNMSRRCPKPNAELSHPQGLAFKPGSNVKSKAIAVAHQCFQHQNSKCMPRPRPEMGNRAGASAAKRRRNFGSWPQPEAPLCPYSGAVAPRQESTVTQPPPRSTSRSPPVTGICECLSDGSAEHSGHGWTAVTWAGSVRLVRTRDSQ